MLKHFFFLLVVLFLFGCGGNPTVSSIVISPVSPSVGINKTQLFTAAAYDAVGTPITATFTWSVNGSLGTINSATGLFTAGGTTGSIVINAVSGGITGSTTASLVSTGSITGTITNSLGAKVSGITVSLTSTPTLYATSSGTGTYTISGVPKGTWEVRTSGNVLYVTTTKEVSVVTGEAASRDIVLRDRFTLASESITPSLVSGVLTNNGTGSATGVTAIYSFYDAYSQYMGGGSGTIGTMVSGESKNFSVIIIPSVSNYSTTTRTFSATSY